MNIIDKAPKTTKEGQKARESLVDRAWLKHEAQNWARLAIRADEELRKHWPTPQEYDSLKVKMEKLGLPHQQWQNFLLTNKEPRFVELRSELSVFLLFN